MGWSRLEVESTVADYFHMLVMELSGQTYNKSAHRQALLKRLDGRTDGAVETIAVRQRNVFDSTPGAN